MGQVLIKYWIASVDNIVLKRGDATRFQEVCFIMLGHSGV